jgi:DNA modification methylase
MSYQEFLASKAPKINSVGINPGNPHPMLFPFQAHLVDWSLRLGSSAIFADCGMGKTLMQLAWADAITTDRCLIVTPLSVAHQTKSMGDRMGIDVEIVEHPTSHRIQIANYQKLDRFYPSHYQSVVLDESSILKSIDGKTRTKLINEWSNVRYRLCCTATPAPNDVAELANHAEFLGALSRVEMLARFFIHDEDGWRLKGHAQDDFWKWVATWARYIRRPSDLGFDDQGFALPNLIPISHIVDSDWKPEGMLFSVGHLGGISDRRRARRASVADRTSRAIGLIKGSADKWIIWCDLNDEADSIERALSESGVSVVQVAGKDSDFTKTRREEDWRLGTVQVLVTKPKIFGFGMNWQHCHHVMFIGVGDSYESYYQSIRRCWRYGQDHDVEVHAITSTAEVEVLENLRRKEADATVAIESTIESMKCFYESKKGLDVYTEKCEQGEGWKMMLGDCVERIKEIPDKSIGLSVFSPPFASLYTYSASDRDMGNCADYDEFFVHFHFLIKELHRVIMNGRRVLVHCQQLSTTKAHHGVIGWRDFRADIVRAFVQDGFVYDGEVVIDKDPQAQAIRTKSKQLMFVQKNKDSSWVRPAMADYILFFRHPEENKGAEIVPDVSNEEWICWARPVWYNIRESDTLQSSPAKGEKDERHICPLQLGTIERCVRLWSNPGDTVLSPFGGIGSEGFVSLRHGRKYIGIELKREYWEVACKNLASANRQGSLFSKEDLA